MFTQNVDMLCDKYAPDVVAYERVRRHVGTTAAHVYGGFLAALEQLDYRWGLVCVAPPLLLPAEVTAWKKRSVGSGRASKEQIVAAMSKRFRFTPGSEDEADALGVAEATRLFLEE